MPLLQSTESELLETGSLKWTGMSRKNGQPALGAWVAEMDFGTAPAVEDRVITAIRRGFLGYTPPWTRDAVTDSLVHFQERRFGWTVKPSWVRMSESVLHSMRAMIDGLTRPGSAIVVPTPAYMPFLTIPQSMGREMIPVPSLHTPNVQRPQVEDPAQAWSLDLDGIEAALKKGAGLVTLCNPWNPTGRVLSVPELEALQEVVSRYDALVFSDEIHAPLVFEDPASFVSYASLGPQFAAHTVTAVAASKAWNIAGLPASQVILPDASLRTRWDEANASGSPIALGAIATVSAYTDGDEWLVEALAQISSNLDLLDQVLAGTMVDYSRPQATYLAWIGFDAYDLDRSPSKILLDDYGVAVNDGEPLGAPYKNWVRLNAAMSRKPWERAVEQIAKFVRSQVVSS